MLIKKARWTLALALGVGGVALGSSLRADRAWAQMIASGVALERALDERDTTRPVLRGEGIDGLAYVEYTRMLQLLSPGAPDAWHEFLADSDQGASAKLARDQWIDSHEEMLDALASAARHTDARFPGMWEAEREKGLSSMMAGRTIVGIAMLASRRHLEAGRYDSAVDVLLDAMQFSRDVMHGPSEIERMVGCSLLQICIGGLQLAEDGSTRLPEAQLGRLSRGMERLDSGLSLGSQGLDGDTLYFIRFVAGSEELDGSLNKDPELWMNSWRHGFSSRQMCADYVQEAMRWRAIEEELQGLSWTEAQPSLEGWIEAAGESSNPLGSIVSQAKLSGVRASLTALARLRMARVAVNYLQTGELETLADPFGRELLISKDRDVLRVESMGPGDQSFGERYTLEIALAGQ